MRRLVVARLVIALLVWTGSALPSPAHPGSGIVVDQEGQVFFQDSVGRVVWKIDVEGKLTKFFEGKGGHWMCLDEKGSFSDSQPKYFERITPPSFKPALVFAEGGSPIAVLSDGNLYYASNDEHMTPGGLQVTRMSPSGVASVFPPDGKATTEKLGITGLAAGPDGALYIASSSTVLKLKMDGTFTTIVHPIKLDDCDVDHPDGNPDIPLPCLRGLAVDEHGTVFAAGTGCHRVVKITPQGQVETILRSERPWSPTGVAVHRGDVYVLEYTNANGSANDGWRPRVRRLGSNGMVTTVATVP